MKWLLLVLVAGLVAGFALYRRDSVKSSYVNGLPQYNALPNRIFLFEQDCYIFKLESEATDWPLVGTQLTVPGLPAEVSDREVGKTINGIRILDIVRTGSRVKLVSVRRDQSRKGTTVTFELLFLDEAQRNYPRLDAFYLLDHSPEARGEPPAFIERYIVPRPVK